jgi:hypothetical protein
MPMIHQITKLIRNSNQNTTGKGIILPVSGSILPYGGGPNPINTSTIDSINRVLTVFFKIHFILISKPIYSMVSTPNGYTLKISLNYFKPKLQNKAVQGRGRFNKVTVRPNYKDGTVVTKLQNAYITKFLGLISSTNISALEVTKINANLTVNKLRFIALLISKMLNVNVELNITRLKYIYLDSNILAQFLGINSHLTTYGQLKKVLRRKVTISTDPAFPSLPGLTNSKLEDGLVTKLVPNTFLTGFKIKISGRLHRQRVVPKQTVKSTYKGFISPTPTNIVDEATYTGKNKKGAFSIKV